MLGVLVGKLLRQRYRVGSKGRVLFVMRGFFATVRVISVRELPVDRADVVLHERVVRDAGDLADDEEGDDQESLEAASRSPSRPR